MENILPTETACFDDREQEIRAGAYLRIRLTKSSVERFLLFDSETEDRMRSHLLEFQKNTPHTLRKDGQLGTLCS